VRREWGLHGISGQAPCVDVLVIVDVLSFSTCVEIATTCGAAILPYPWQDGSAEDFALQEGAELARRRGTGWSVRGSPIRIWTDYGSWPNGMKFRCKFRVPKDLT
jgi:2-phosphosulfolactate phosphatase